MTQLKSSEFKTAQAYPCGYENRDAVNSYQKDVPVQETPIAKIIKERGKTSVSLIILAIGVS